MGIVKKTKSNSLRSKIYILHGWTYDVSKWDKFISLLGKNHDVSMLKIPGLTAELSKVFTIDDYVEWLRKEIEKEKEVILIGHSNGGRIASIFAVRYPEKVSKLVLIDSAGIYHNDISLKLKRLVFKTIAKAGKKITKSKFLETLLYKAAREKDYKESSPLVKKTMENLIKFDVTPLLPNIKATTLIVWGENDKVTPLADGEKMNSLIHNSKIEIIKGTRHSPQFTNTEQVVGLINNFIL